MSLLQVKGLSTEFRTQYGAIKAVDALTFAIDNCETVGLVGESGCGKSVTGLSIMRLIPNPPGKIAAGEILFQESNLLSLDESEMRRVRGSKISMIFQEPMTSLNPVFTVGNQISEVLKLHHGMNAFDAMAQTVDLLAQVGIPNPKARVYAYPHELSGGMRQRVMIAMALACKPKLLIADEPTTALDVTIQAQILELLKSLQEQYGMAVLLISHDLGVIAEVCHRVVVMYAGRVVEIAAVEELYDHALHPYTQALYASLPSMQRDKSKGKLFTIKGSVPPLHDLPVGCKFSDRCEKATDDCRKSEPELREIQPGHFVRCIHADKWL